MSERVIGDKLRVNVRPLTYFVGQIKDRVDPNTYLRMRLRMDELGLQFPQEECLVIATLNTPRKVQRFINTNLTYNQDHIINGSMEQNEETALSPRMVLRTALGHCFEAGLLAYMINYLHGYDPRLVFLEGIFGDDDHTIVRVKGKDGRYGANAQSSYRHLRGRPMVFSSDRELAESYKGWYTFSARYEPERSNLVGYSEPIDMVEKFGTGWMDTLDPIWQEYHSALDRKTRLYSLTHPSKNPHQYGLYKALEKGWIVIEEGLARLAIDNLPGDIRIAHRSYEANSAQVGNIWDNKEMLTQQQKMFARTGTTSPDLISFVSDINLMLQTGFDPRDLYL